MRSIAIPLELAVDHKRLLAVPLCAPDASRLISGFCSSTRSFGSGFQPLAELASFQLPRAKQFAPGNPASTLQTRLTTTHLRFSLPSALRNGFRRTAGTAKPGHRTCTYEVTRHARRT